VRIPWAVTKCEFAVEFLDVDYLTDLADVDNVWWEVPLALDATDGSRIFGPPLVVHGVGSVNDFFTSDVALEFQKRVTLMSARRFDPISEAEVSGGAGELRLAVGL
tara:strand:- start:15 stop:332 length:318 start_codon:yes stop_codon:yes gene_type:complete